MEEIKEQFDREKIEKRLEGNTFCNVNHIWLESVERDRAVFALTVREESTNPYGMIHGGALYTMADDATGVAAHTDGRSYVTQEGSLHFLRNQTKGTVRAEARVRHRGKATVLLDVDITGEDGTLLATGQFTYFCIDPERMPEKRKSRE